MIGHAAHIESVFPDGAGGCVVVARGTPLDIPYRVVWISNKGKVKKIEVSSQVMTPMMVTPNRFYLGMYSSTGPNIPFLRRLDFKNGSVTSKDMPFERPYMVRPIPSPVEDKKGFFVIPTYSDQFQPIGGPVTIYRYKH